MSASTRIVGDLCEQIRGVTYSKEEATSEPAPGYKPVLRANNITDVGLSFGDLVYVPESRVSPRQHIRANDVLIAASSGSIDVVGKAARATVDFDGGFGAFCKVLRPNGDIDPGYFAHFFRTPNYRLRVSGLAAGANINNLRNEHIDGLKIRVPPVSEQRRIAAILDKADALRAKRRDAIAKVDELLKSVFLDMFGEPLYNPKKWPRRPLVEIALVQTGGTPPASAAGMFDGDIPFITPSDLGGEVETSRRTVTRKGAEAARVAKAGSTLVCCIGATIGKMGFIRRDGAFNQQINAVTWTGAVLPLYGYHAMRFLSNEIAHKGASTTLPILKKSSFEKLELIVPPPAEQNRFNEFAERMTVQSKKLQSSANSLSETFSSLQSVLFRGS